MGLSTKVELRLQAKNLINRDSTSKSDPFCVIHRRQQQTHEYVEIGRTEHILDNLNPKWEMKFTLDYQFEERQELKFTVYDWDGEKKNLADHDYLGSALVSLGEIVSAKYSKFEIPLELPKKLTTKTTNSTLVVYSEELGTSQETFQLTVNGRGLDKKDFLGKSDPFLIVSKQTDDSEWTQVFLTEVIKKTLDPDWRPIAGQVTALTGKNPTRKLLFQVYDHDKDEKHDLIGQFETTLEELKTRTKQSGTTSFPLINPKKKEKKKGYENSGTLNIVSFKVDEKNFTFVDYLQSGIQLHFTVAIDFTASNKKPSDPNSLHCILPNQDNQYILAIKSVGNIIQDYDTDKFFPALGFGAKIPPSTEVTHEFFLNFNPQNPFCNGVEGILEAYQTALKTVRLSGPTYFAPVINHCAKFANTYKDGSNYFVLLIITDGMICDLEATKEAVIAASSLPLSIIIVGVGEEDFSSMEFLDADKRVLKSSTGIVAARDIVQFVALRDFLGKHGENYEATKEDLAKAVLAEIPNQFMEFMGTKQITPL